MDALQSLFEKNLLSEDVRADIEAAWNSRITENRREVAEQLREEFAQKYEHDRSTMIEAVDRMITDGISEEIREFTEDRHALAEMKVKIAKKATKDRKIMKEFITRQLASEIHELHEDQKTMAGKFGKLEQFVIEALADEITEFYQDKRDVTKTRVRMVKEGREKLKKVQEQFVKRAAKLVDKTVTESLTRELTNLKEDINTARRNDFGRKLFEAFAMEYQTSYLNEKSETSKLLKMVKHQESQLQEARKTLSKREKLLETHQREIVKISESRERDKIMNELLGPLNKDQREIMSELLENVKISKINESFDKYLPAVLAGQTPIRKQALMEAREITGNRISNTSSEEDSNIVDIRRLAGLKN